MATVSSAPRELVGQEPAARTQDAVKLYGKGETEVRALDGVSVGFTAGRFTAIMGPSGSGKSSLVHCAAGLDSLSRELGVLRAVGMTRSQLRTSIRWESVIIALQGTVLGLLVGVFFGWALVLSMKSQGITEFSIPALSLVIVVLLAGLAGFAAAILPSRRAAKLNILRAIASE
jgi:energy-coupling factor transporter ATP-binding protein EcfA2